MSISIQLITSAIAIVLMTSCSLKSKDIVGKWVIPISGQEDQSWGFELKKDGSAKSINASTLLYESWILNHDTLLLSGKSVGIGQTISFTDTLIIQDISTNNLILETTNGYEFTYTLLK